MSYIKKILLPDERIIYSATLHWVIYLNGLAITASAGLLGYFSFPLMAFLFGPDLAHEFGRAINVVALILVLSGSMLLLGAYIRQTATELVITNHRLIAKYGFISRTTFEIMISRITGANFDQTIVGRLMGYGTIWVHGAGGEISPISGVSDPQMFYRALISMLDQAQSGGRVVKGTQI